MQKLFFPLVSLYISQKCSIFLLDFPSFWKNLIHLTFLSSSHTVKKHAVSMAQFKICMSSLSNLISGSEKKISVYSYTIFSSLLSSFKPLPPAPSGGSGAALLTRLPPPPLLFLPFSSSDDEVPFPPTLVVEALDTR